jgi:AraC family transcriptional regulator
MEQPFTSCRSRSVLAADLVVTSAWFAPSLRLGRHHHAKGSVSVILSGGYDSVIAGSPRRCTERAVVLTPPAEPHHNVFLPAQTQMLVVEMGAPLEELPPSCARALERPGALESPGIAQLARRAALEVEHPDDVAPLACEGLALELVAMTLRLREAEGRDRSPPRWLRDARDLLHDDASRSISVGSLARAAGVERTRLIRAFRRHYQTTPAAYLRRLRVERAARLLSETAEPIVAIALAAGFADQSHLNRVFKRLMGCTPASFRGRRP